ncbi:unnamed protein product [Sphagnum tenellum]
MLQKPALLLQAMKAPGIVLQCGTIHAQKHYLLLPELLRGGTRGRSSLSALPRCYSAVLFQPISVDHVCLGKLGRSKFAFNFVPQSKSRPGCQIYASKEGEELDAEWGGHHSSQQDKLIVQSEDEEAESGFIVVNFYYFVEVEDPHHEVAQHTSFMEGRDIRGRIYISHQGINAQLSGPRVDAMAYAEWVKKDPRFSSIFIQVSPCLHHHAFPRLKLRYKPSLVQVEGGTAHLPVTDLSIRAEPLTPQQWREKLKARAIVGTTDSSRLKRVLLLDVRNGYEWDVGHFRGAQRPNVDCFKSTEFGLSEEKDESDDPLSGINKDVDEVMMYCTGGIRCDVYSTMLRQKGFKNLFTLKGGVARYLKEEGSSMWAGNLFVFDSRLSVPPEYYCDKEREKVEENVLKESDTGSEAQSLSAFARCQLCGDPLPEAWHRNCANLDCNKLYLSCPDCVKQHAGCCCDECLRAPRLRPLLDEKQPYERWHNYRPEIPKPSHPPGYISRRALKRQRRKERRRECEINLQESKNGGVVMSKLVNSSVLQD